MGRTATIKGGYDKKLYMTPIYRSWVNMKTRCYNENVSHFVRYGGRGISVCERWFDFSNFHEDMSPTYREDLTLDRIDNNGNYCKENCRWADREVQANNRRTNHLISFMGQDKNFEQWARLSGIKRSTFSMRFHKYNWPFKKCFEGGPLE